MKLRLGSSILGDRPLLEMADGDAPARGDDVVLWPAWGGVPEVFETATQVVDIACTAHEVPRLRGSRDVSFKFDCFTGLNIVLTL